MEPLFLSNYIKNDPSCSLSSELDRKFTRQMQKLSTNPTLISNKQVRHKKSHSGISQVFVQDSYHPQYYFEKFFSLECQQYLYSLPKLNTAGLPKIYTSFQHQAKSNSASIYTPLTRCIQTNPWYYPVMNSDICWALVHVALIAIPVILRGDREFFSWVDSNTAVVTNRSKDDNQIQYGFFQDEFNNPSFQLFKQEISNNNNNSRASNGSNNDGLLHLTPHQRHHDMTMMMMMAGTTGSSLEIKLDECLVQTPEFAEFIYNILSRMNLSSLVFFLALKYMSRLRVCFPQVQPKPGCERRLFLIAYILANKTMYDRVYHNHHYEEVTLIPICDINRMEREFLDIIGYNLVVEKDEFIKWMGAIEKLIKREIKTHDYNTTCTKLPSLQESIFGTKEPHNNNNNIDFKLR